jgi:hypothetical protein
MSHWWIVGILLLNACAPIKETMNVTTQTSQSLTAGVGDVVLRAENLQNLPNVFGASDIWGRTRSTGFTTIQYGGMDATGKIVLIRSGVITQSDASTVNAGTFSTSAQQPTIPMTVDWKREPRIPASGHVIVAEGATPTSLTYHIE